MPPSNVPKFVPNLVPVSDAIRAGEGIPSGFYLILKRPAPLAGCELPYGDVDWNVLQRAGFRHVICLSSETPRYNPFPLVRAVACELDDLSIRKRPARPALEAEKIIRIAEFVVAALRAGEGVLVHCAAGRGRTGSVLGVVLRLFGLPARDVVAFMRSV